MSLLEGKTALVFGLANEHSIAWGIIKAFLENGAKIGISYAGEVMERRVRPLAEQIGCTFVEPCDITDDGQIEQVRDRAQEVFGEIDILVHAIAFAGTWASSTKARPRSNTPPIPIWPEFRKISTRKPNSLRKT